MAPTRRQALAALGALTAAPWAQAQAFPSRTLTLVVVAPPGGAVDLAARGLQEPLGRALGQPVVIDNKGGGNGTVGGNAVLAAPRDGHTLLLQFSGFQTMTPHLVKLPYDPMKEFQAVCNVMSAPQVLVIRPTLEGVTTAADLVRHARANPGKLNYASGGNGSVQHVAAELFQANTGTRMSHIPFKGSAQMVTSVLSGDVDMVFTTAPALIQHIQVGKLRPLLVSSRSRLSSLPAVPTSAEAGIPDFEVSSWFALYAQAQVPGAAVQRIADEVARIVAAPAFQQMAETQGAQPDFMNPQQLRTFAQAEYDRWGRIIRTAGIRGD
ncbi:MAG TPA: tripartite tricarboxylate transporter substrate binding protein [Ramlibacter sp.]|nr:tripartite tricarboxylate transporter substrate binding protein [Ramlibacter sp.]